MEAVGEDGRLFHFAEWLYLYNPNLSGDTIENYISTVRQHLLINAPWIGWRRSPILDAYIKRMQQQPYQRQYKEPINKSVISAIVSDISLDPAVRVAILFAFYGLWRVGDYTYDRRFEVQPHELRRSDVTFHEDGVSIHISHSKSDHYNAGADHFFHATNNDRCPVKMLKQYLGTTKTKHDDRPLFQLRDGRHLHRRDIDTAVKRHATLINVDPKYVSTHSIRIGGAFELKDKGVDWHTIVARARWKPITAKKMLLLYTRMSKARLSDVFSALDIDDPATAIPVIPPSRRAHSVAA